MAGWLRVTAIPNKPDAPQARFLVSLDRIWGFNAIPGEPVQLWFSADQEERALSIVESMEDIEFQLGMGPPVSLERRSYTSDDFEMVGNRLVPRGEAG